MDLSEIQQAGQRKAVGYSKATLDELAWCARTDVRAYIRNNAMGRSRLLRKHKERYRTESGLQPGHFFDGFGVAVSGNRDLVGGFGDLREVGGG